jgi:hypothetical protein
MSFAQPRKFLPALAILAFTPLAASTQDTLAQQGMANFVCNAPTGHVCQFRVMTPTGPIDFALASGERREVPGVTPVSDKYCVCDPGPVTENCQAPQLGHWCLGTWVDVKPGLNSKLHAREPRYADK